MFDETARHNRERWEELAKARVRFARPYLDLDKESARELIDPHGLMGRIEGKDVLLLAGAGGQQSAAFGLLGATVTVLDFSPTQLDRDRIAAEHYGYDIRLVETDMRDLSMFESDSFDIVWNAHSLNFVPDPDTVFREVSRVIRHGGFFRLSFWNPFIHGTSEEEWDGNGYPVYHLYADGDVLYDDPMWYFEDPDGNDVAIEGPQEFRHTLSTLINELTSRGYVILGFWEDSEGDPDAEPGTWEHFKTVCAPWLTLWTRYNPKAFLRH
jgi:SAM-dependent methyltransferase